MAAGPRNRGPRSRGGNARPSNPTLSVLAHSCCARPRSTACNARDDNANRRRIEAPSATTRSQSLRQPIALSEFHVVSAQRSSWAPLPFDACCSSCFGFVVATTESGGTSTTLVPSRDDRRVTLTRTGCSNPAAFGPRFIAHRVTHAMPSGGCSLLRTWVDYNHTLPVEDTQNLTKVHAKLLIRRIVFCAIRHLAVLLAVISR